MVICFSSLMMASRLSRRKGKGFWLNLQGIKQIFRAARAETYTYRAGLMSFIQSVPQAAMRPSGLTRMKKGSSLMPHFCTRGLAKLRKSQ